MNQVQTQFNGDAVTLPKAEYERLRWLAERFELMRQLVGTDFFTEPATRDTAQILSEFRATGLYTEEFLRSFKQGP